MTMRSATMNGWCSGRSMTPEPSMMSRGALRRRGDHDLGRGEDFDGAAVVLADPGLVEVDAVEELHELEVLVEQSVGFSPTRWCSGAMKTPNFMRSGR